MLRIMKTKGQALSALAKCWTRFPQLVTNIRVREKQPLDQIATVSSAIRRAEQDLQGSGRVVVRYSGTEPLARVMIEAESQEKMQKHVEAIAGAIQGALGA